jgi:hypothetical protein
MATFSFAERDVEGDFPANFYPGLYPKKRLSAICRLIRLRTTDQKYHA